MKNLISIVTSLFIVLILLSCDARSQKKNEVIKVKLIASKGKAIAAFAEGCFWCSEHIYDEVAGVDSAVSGYAGGKTSNPTYESVSAENTGHAETVLVYYNPKVVSYEELCKVFFASHDPTTLNQQGPDQGSSYRSVLFYITPEEEKIAKQTLHNASKSG
ncbi:MAG: peptide-methionine (S)-S-oxide reductase MsrA, partial [Daejeonella sp.]